MDINFLRSAVTISGLLLFVVLVAWTWLPSRRTVLDEAARAPFLGDAESTHE